MRTTLFVAALLCSAAAHAETRLTGDLPRREARPLEALAGIDIEYGAVRMSEGVRLRTIVTRPAGASGRLPAIFLTQAVSCGSIELPADRPTMLGELARRSGMVLIRVERSGTGDSEGAGCEALDYDTEVRHYREAFDALARHKWVDPRRMFILGSSLGSTIAPLVAEGKGIAGVAVQGGGALTYLERMIHFDRLYLERSGQYAPDAIHNEMIRRITFHQLYLIGRKTPQQIAAERPDLATVWRSIRGGAEAPPHYGRPYAWHWQAASKNFLAAWARVEAPVLVGYAEFDQFEPLQSHRIIVDSVNRMRPGSATLIELTGLDHSLRRYPDALAAYREEGGEPGREDWLAPLIAWLKDKAS